MRLEADDRVLTDGIEKVYDWLDLGDYAPIANIGAHALPTFEPRLVTTKYGNRSIRIDYESPAYMQLSYGIQFNDFKDGLTWSFYAQPGTLESYGAIFDCGTAEDTSDLKSLEGRIFIGSDVIRDNLSYHVFGTTGQKVTYVAADAALNGEYQLFTIRQSYHGFTSISVGADVRVASGGALPPTMNRTRCNFGKSLLSNKEGNGRFAGDLRAFYAFKRPLSDVEIGSLNTYVKQRWPMKY